MIRSLLSIFTILIFTTQSLLAEMSPAGPGDSSAQSTLKQFAEIDLSRFGQIKASFQGTKKETLIYIQDAHANLEGQENIARLIDRIAPQMGISLVNVEGASGELQHKVLGAYPNLKARKTVAKYFLKEAKLTGPEFLAITKRPELTLYGIEIPALYEKHRRIFLAGLERFEKGQMVVAQLKRRLEALAPHVFSNQLRTLIQLREGSLGEPENFYAYLTFLKKIAVEYAVDLKPYPELAELIRHMDAPKPVRGKRLPVSNNIFDEIEQLERSMTNQMMRNEEERKLEELYRIVQVMAKFLSFTATRFEWEYFQRERGRFDAVRCLRHIQDLSSRHRFDLEAPENLHELNRDLSLAENFYRLAQKRDRVLALKAIAKMKADRKPISILVAGGFHASGIEAHLRSQGYSYVVIVPKISKPFNQRKQEERYRNAVRYHASQKTALSYGTLPSKNALFASPGHLAALSLLLNEEKAQALLRRPDLMGEDLLQLPVKNPQLDFNLTFSLLLQLEDAHENPSQNQRVVVEQIKKNLPASLDPLVELLYENFLETEPTVIRGEDPSMRFLVGREFPSNRRFLISMRKTSHEVAVKPVRRWVREVYEMNGRRYEWGLADSSMIPVKRKTGFFLEDVFPLPVQPAFPKLLARSETRMADTKLHKVDVDLYAYKKHLQRHLREKSERPLPEILEALQTEKTFFEIFPFMEKLASAEHAEIQGVNVFQQMLDSARFLWEYETAPESSEFQKLFRKIVSTPEEREAAYLTALLFDIGKLGRPAGHEERGAKWLAPIFKKIGLGQNVRERSLWVIRRHGFLGEIFLWHTLPSAVFDDLRDVSMREQRKDLVLLALINAADTHAWYGEKTPYTRQAAKKYLEYIETDFSKMNIAEERFRAFSSRRTPEGLIFDEKKYSELKVELAKFEKKAGKSRYHGFLVNWGKDIQKLFYAVAILEKLDAPSLVRTLFLLSQIRNTAVKEHVITQIGFTAPSRLADKTIGPLVEAIKRIPERELIGLDKRPFSEVVVRLKKYGLEVNAEWSERRISVNNAKFLDSRPARRSEVRTTAVMDKNIQQAQLEYESTRGLTYLGGPFGEDKGGEAYFGLHKQKYLLKQAIGDPKWSTPGDPRFYFDAVGIYLGPEDADETVELLESFKGKSIPDYAFIFRTDEPLSLVKDRLEKFRTEFADHIVPFGVVTGNVAGTLGGTLWARRAFREYLQALGYSWEALKVKPILLAWGSGGRVFPMGRHNKILANSPISEESYLEENLRGILQYFQPKMKRSEQPGQNFVIYPDSNKLIDQELEIGKHDFQFIGSLVNHDQKELNELGIANLDKDGRLVNFIEKAKDTTEIEMRLGPGIKFRSFGDVYGTDVFFDELDRRYSPHIQDSKLVVDFALHLGEASTLGNQPMISGTHGLEKSEWFEKKIDKLKDLKIKGAILAEAAHLAKEFSIGAAYGGFESRFIHSNNMEANYEMMLHLAGDPFIRDFAGVQADMNGSIIGRHVVLGEHVSVAPGAVILGHTIIKNGRIGEFAVIRDVWADTLNADSKSLVNEVDARERQEILHVNSGFYINDVFIQNKSRSEKVRYVRRINEDINAPVNFSAIVLTTGSLQTESGTIDPSTMKAIINILKAKKSAGNEAGEENGPMIAFVSQYDLEEIKKTVFQHIPKEFWHRFIIYSENGARATGFRPQSGVEVDYFRHIFPKINKLKKRIRRALKQLGIINYQIERTHPAVFSLSHFDRKDYVRAAQKLQSGFPDLNVYVDEGNQIHISLSDRKGVVLDLMNRYQISKRPNQRILIVGADAGRVVHNGMKSVPGIDTSLTELVIEPQFEGRVYSLSVNPYAPNLSIAVERPTGYFRYQTTVVDALEEVKRTIEQPVSHRNWRIIQNRFSMQDIKKYYSRIATNKFDEDRMREIQRLKRGQQNRSELRDAETPASVDRGRYAATILSRRMGEHMATGSQNVINRIVRWFAQQQPRSSTPDSFSSQPSIFIAEWDSFRLTLADIDIAGNALPAKSLFILRVPENEKAVLRESINQKVALKGGRRILLSSWTLPEVIESLAHLPQYRLSKQSVYQLAVEPALLKQEFIYRGLWHGARGYIQPGRIVVFTKERFNFPGAEQIVLDRSMLQDLLTSLSDAESIKTQISRAA